MRLIIDLPKEQYDLVKKESKDSTTELCLMNAVANGIPLPKGHDRLVEARAVIKALFSKKTIDDVPTIVEADKVESEEE